MNQNHKLNEWMNEWVNERMWRRGAVRVLCELLTFVDIMKPQKFAFCSLLFVLQLVKVIVASVCVF